MSKCATRGKKSFSPRRLPLFLYDLTSASRILPPAAILPEQFHASPRKATSFSREASLMRSVLEDAIDCLQQPASKNTPEVQRLAQDAELWFFADDDHWPFSFMNICAALGLDAAYVRRGLQPWRQPSLPPAKTRRLRKTTGRQVSPIAA
jgi:hypothetical protein